MSVVHLLIQQPGTVTRNVHEDALDCCETHAGLEHICLTCSCNCDSMSYLVMLLTKVTLSNEPS